MSRYLIVGAGGFIGGHLVNRLLNEGNEATSLVGQEKEINVKIGDKLAKIKIT